MTDYPQAIQHRGPSGKVWPEPNARAGVILHSAEGSIAPLLAELDDPTDLLSWHFSVAKDGTAYQHYNLEESPWHAGSHAQNIRLIGIEHEGRAGESLTRLQQAASIALVAWVAAQCGWAPSHATGPAQTLWAHSDVPGANTTCPNGRIPWGAYTPSDERPRRLDVAQDADVRAWLLPLSNVSLLSPLRFDADAQGRRLAVYEAKVYLPEG